MWSTLKDLLLWIPRELFAKVMEGLSALLQAIPAPDWYANISNIFQGDNNVHFFLMLCAVTTGLKILAASYGIRFLIRRIPFIGG
ncbi:hypothetical protein [Mangrovitalea sediminis]|uniref:hypothetical protein n=1 Tax=Mangrovitalea sediminis TaxID=1982043 RepID=UPI000BE5E42F|nr:hypothetical protein [Mangrovitalea sediminis]